MKKALVLAAIFSGLALSTGCEQKDGGYDIVRAGDRSYLLNSTTGQTQLISGTSLVPIKAFQTEADDAIGAAKDWPVSTLVDGVNISVRTKYRDGQMLYSIDASPFKGRLQNELSTGRSPSIYVVLYDPDGFQTAATLQVLLRDATQIVNDKGVAQSLSWSGSHPIPADSYRAASTLSLRWVGFSEREPQADPASSAADAAAAAADAAVAAAEAAAAAAASTE